MNGLPEIVHINNLKKYSGPSVIPEDTQCSEQDVQAEDQKEAATGIVPANNQEDQQQRRDMVPQGANLASVAPSQRKIQDSRFKVQFKTNHQD